MLCLLATLAVRAYGASFAILDSERGDRVGDGRHWVLTSPGGSFVGESLGLTADGLNGAIHASGFAVEFSRGDDVWRFNFSAPPGFTDLVPGTYQAEVPQFGPLVTAGLDVGHGTSYCSSPRGTFTVNDVAVGPSGDLLTADVEFAQRCDVEGPALRGLLRFRVGDRACAGAPDGSACD